MWSEGIFEKCHEMSIGRESLREGWANIFQLGEYGLLKKYKMAVLSCLVAHELQNTLKSANIFLLFKSYVNIEVGKSSYIYVKAKNFR